MIDVQKLRPADASPASLASALSRCEKAGIDLAAELIRLRQNRVNLLIVGTPENLAATEEQIRSAAEAGDRVVALHEELKRRLDTALKVPPSATEITARAAAVEAANQARAWWIENAGTMERGIRLIGAAMEAMAAWQLASTGAAPGTNVVPITRPGA